MEVGICVSILKEWQNQKMGISGCTIPFLVGISKELDPPQIPNCNEASKIIEYLFTNRNASEKFRIGLCPKLKCPVVEINTKGDLDYTDGEWVTKNLYIDEAIFKRYGPTVDEVSEQLISESCSRISNDEFSLVDDKWGDYSEKEKEFIKKIIRR